MGLVDAARAAGASVPHEVHHGEGGTGAAGDHHVGVTAGHHVGGFYDGQQRRDVASDYRIARAAGVVEDPDVRGRHVGQILQEPQRKHFADSRAAPTGVIEAAAAEVADAVARRQLGELGAVHVGAHGDAQPVGVDAGVVEPSLGPGQLGGGETELRLAGHHLEGLARLDECLGVEVDHHARNGDGKAGLGQLGDGPDAAGALFERPPDGLVAHADGRGDAHPGDDDFVDGHGRRGDRK